MPTEMKLWKVDGNRPAPVLQQRLNLESRLEEWLRADVSLISGDLLVIGQQVETAYGGYIDLLAVDRVGNLVILELKRDKTPRDIVAQALDYASWVQDLGHESISEIANGFLKGKALEEAFREKFQTNLPDVLNERHRMYIVASAKPSRNPWNPRNPCRSLSFFRLSRCRHIRVHRHAPAVSPGRPRTTNGRTRAAHPSETALLPLL